MVRRLAAIPDRMGRLVDPSRWRTGSAHGVSSAHPASSSSSGRTRHPYVAVAIGIGRWLTGVDEPGLPRRLSRIFREAVALRTFPESLANSLGMADLCHVELSNLSLPRQPVP